MFTISDSIFINAPIERCFLLSTNIELVGRALGMKPIEGKTSGLVVAERQAAVGWVEVRVSRRCMRASLPNMNGLRFFRTRWSVDASSDIQHDHYFYEMNERTVLNDKIRFTMPLGFAGRLVGRVCAGAVPLEAAATTVSSAEDESRRTSKEWQKYLPEEQQVAMKALRGDVGFLHTTGISLHTSNKAAGTVSAGVCISLLEVSG